MLWGKRWGDPRDRDGDARGDGIGGGCLFEEKRSAGKQPLGSHRGVAAAARTGDDGQPADSKARQTPGRGERYGTAG